LIFMFSEKLRVGCLTCQAFLKLFFPLIE